MRLLHLPNPHARLPIPLLRVPQHPRLVSTTPRIRRVHVSGVLCSCRGDKTLPVASEIAPPTFRRHFQRSSPCRFAAPRPMKMANASPPRRGESFWARGVGWREPRPTPAASPPPLRGGDFHRSPEHRWGARCEVRKKMAIKSPPRRGKGRQAMGWVVEGCDGPTPALRDRCRCAPPLPRGDFLRDTLP